MSRDAIRRAGLLEFVARSVALGDGGKQLEQLVERAVRVYLDHLAGTVLATGETVVIPGFGTFYRATWAPTALGGKRGGPKRRLAFKAASKLRGRA